MLVLTALLVFGIALLGVQALREPFPLKVQVCRKPRSGNRQTIYRQMNSGRL